LRRHVRAERLRIRGRCGIEGLVFSGYRIAGEGDLVNFAFLDLLDEDRKRYIGTCALARRRQLPDQQADHDQSYPEQQALQGRIHWNPFFTVKITTPSSGALPRPSSAIVTPATH